MPSSDSLERPQNNSNPWPQFRQDAAPGRGSRLPSLHQEAQRVIDQGNILYPLLLLKYYRVCSSIPLVIHFCVLWKSCGCRQAEVPSVVLLGSCVSLGFNNQGVLSTGSDSMSDLLARQNYWDSSLGYWPTHTVSEYSNNISIENIYRKCSK